MTVKSDKEINRGVGVGGLFILLMTGVAFVVGALSNVYFVNNPKFGDIAMKAAGGNIDKIIPLYINAAMPTWFVYVFMLTLLSAAMSTSSSQFHAMGTAFGRDLFDKTIFKGKMSAYTVLVTRIGILCGVIVTVLLGYKLPESVIAVATAIFFGLCASTFLPTYWGALFWKRMTKMGAKASMLVGFLLTAFWFLFVHKKEAEAIGLCKAVFGTATLLDKPWVVVDPIVVALPLSFLTAVLVSLWTRPPALGHVAKCFKHIGAAKG